jgi:hypothetical protein
MMKRILLSITAIAAIGTMSSQVTMYSEDFEDTATIGMWSIADLDADGNNWGFYDLSASTSTHLNPLNTAAGSQSWDGTAGLNPDNLLISPPIDLTTASGTIMLSWDVASAESATSTFAAEEYSVYATNDPLTAAVGAADFNEILPDGGTVYNRSIDISSMAGSDSVYFVIRHHNTFDMNLLVADNILITATSGTTSVDEIVLAANVFPNPANDMLNIKLNKNIAGVNVYSLDGKIVIVESANSTSTSINTSGLTAGMYVYEIIGTDGRSVRDTLIKG